MLLKHQRTVILVTQKTNLVHHSDYVNILLVNVFTSSTFLRFRSTIRPHHKRRTLWCVRAIGRNVDVVTLPILSSHSMSFQFLLCVSFFVSCLFFPLSCSGNNNKKYRNWFGFTIFWIILATTVTITRLTMTIYIRTDPSTNHSTSRPTHTSTQNPDYFNGK